MARPAESVVAAEISTVFVEAAEVKQEEKNAEIKSDKLNQDVDIQSGEAELGAAVDPPG